MSKLALAWASVLIVLAGCSDGTPTPAATTTAPDPGSSAPPAATPTAPESTSTVRIPGADCLNGTWRLVRFVGFGQQSTYGTGQGGDITVTFDKGDYTVIGRGKKPITVNLAGESANLRMDGTVKGTYAPDRGRFLFTLGEATGEATLESGHQRQTLPIATVARVVAPNGTATVACPKNVLSIALSTVRLELER